TGLDWISSRDERCGVDVLREPVRASGGSRSARATTPSTSGYLGLLLGLHRELPHFARALLGQIPSGCTLHREPEPETPPRENLDTREHQVEVLAEQTDDEPGHDLVAQVRRGVRAPPRRESPDLLRA